MLKLQKLKLLVSKLYVKTAKTNLLQVFMLKLQNIYVILNLA